jgi:glutamyl/glutaminyl-tRNA synthetase
MNFRKTRLAPTPSGYLHIGNVLSFATTVALAKKSGAHTLLRIDDIDRDRTDIRFVQDIFDTLNFLDMPWDEGPRNVTEFRQVWSQQHRTGLYNAALDQLREQGRVFACKCTRKDIQALSTDGSYPGTCRDKNIPLDADNVCWRIRTDTKIPIQVKLVDGSTISSEFPKDMTDFIVRRKDGFIAYQITSLVDDVHFGVDLIVRGEDLWHSTLAQHFLASKLGYTSFSDAAFYHHPLIAGPDGLKLSKSAGATSIQFLRESGKSAPEIFAIIAQMLYIDGASGNWEELFELIKGK